MYGLYQVVNPPSVRLATFNPVNGQLNIIGSSVLSTMVNATGSTLNPYNQTYSYQDEDSWLSVDLQSGIVINDVVASLPNTIGSFNNFRFNTADTTMYGLYCQVFTDPNTGFVTSDIRLAECDVTSGQVSLISSNSIANNYTASGSTVDPFLMVYYFESEGKFMGLDLYNGEIYSEPTITIPSHGLSFDNFAYSCADTSIYGLIMSNAGVKSLGKINPQSGVVTALPTALSFDNYVMNSGGAIDPVNLVYYFQTMNPSGQINMVGLSLLDGSIVSQSAVGGGNYFIMYRIQSDCYAASPSRLNPMNNVNEQNVVLFQIHPNPANDKLFLSANSIVERLEVLDVFGQVVERFTPNEMNLHLSVEGLAKGLYYLRVSSNASSSTERFIKN